MVFSLSSAPKALAASEFKTSFHSTYTVNLDGSSLVTHTITLTNQLAHIYPTKYTILTGPLDQDALTTTQDGTPIPFQLKEDDDSTTLTLTDLRPVVGQGQATSLEVSYQVPHIVEQLGRTASINIPRLSRANEAEEFVRTVILPPELGLPSAQYPPASSTTSTEDGHTQLSYKGYSTTSLTLLFGESEYYLLDLTYELYNPTLAAAETELALPPDTSYQRVILDELDPPPLNLHLDQDGNWLAVYSLKSKETRQVHARVYLEVFPTPHAPPVPPNLKSLTKPLQYWESDSQEVTSLAAKLDSPANLYQYLVDNFSYDAKRLESGPAERLGAAAALANPSSAICTEYTDTFIALARALHIPARELEGYAYTTNPTTHPGSGLGTVLHAWPEYYDEVKKTWVQLDPTWGHTTGGIDYFHKLDFNHLVFVIHGQESDYPLPAGAYQRDPNLDAVQVRLVDSLPPLDTSFSEEPTDHGLRVTNLGNVAIDHPQAGHLPPLGSTVVSPSSALGRNLNLPRLYPYLVFSAIALVTFLLVHRLRRR